MNIVLYLQICLFSFHKLLIMGLSDCECHSTWAKCNHGYGEDGIRGCGRSQQNCAQQCPGNLPWKKLYQQSVNDLIKIENECKEDPTAKWGQMNAGTSGPFAIAFAGGLRNFVATWHSWEVNLVEASGGNVHTYFHVWHDEHTNANSAVTQRGVDLAKNLPYTKGYVQEPYKNFMKLLHQDEPDFTGNTGTNESWLSPLEKEFPAESGKSPYTYGPGYSQFRKVHLVMKMIKDSQINYSIIIRARPDHIFIAPMDLRVFALDYSRRESVINARGHFIAIPERHQGQLMSDHFAMGTAEVMFAYGEKPLPYTTACCEGYVHRNLDMRCVYRNQESMHEEFTSVRKVEEAFQLATVKDGMGWSVVPPELRKSVFSPIVNNEVLLAQSGSRFCRGTPTSNSGTSSSNQFNRRCIPMFKSKLTYIYNIVTSAWMRAGLMCIGRYAQKAEADFLIFSGYANSTDEDGAKKYGFGPCMVVPTLFEPWQATKRYLATLEDVRRKKLGAELSNR